MQSNWVKCILSSLSLCLITATTSPALAQTNIAPEMAAMFACKAMTNPTERLACFDQAVSGVETAQESGDLVTISRSQVQEVEKDAFGFNLPSLPKLSKIFGMGGKDSDETKSAETKPPKFEKVKEVTYEVASVETFGRGQKRFTLKNGQVWQQVDKTVPRLPKIKSGDAIMAEIRRAAMGSYLLRLNKRGSSVRVQRIK